MAITSAISVEGMLLTTSLESVALAIFGLAVVAIPGVTGRLVSSTVRWPAGAAISSSGSALVVALAVAPTPNDRFWLGVGVVGALLLKGACHATAAAYGRSARDFATECLLAGLVFVGLNALVSIPAVVLLAALVAFRHSPLLARARRVGWPPTSVAMGAAAVLAATFLLSNITQAASEVRGCRMSPELRGTSDVPEDGTIRIATLGDSSTYGFFMPDRLTYAVRLERLLNRGFAAARFRVLNCGVGGARSRDLAAQYARARPYRPAVVTIYIGVNDGLAEPARFPARVEEYRRHVTEAVRAAKADGARVLLLTSPVRYWVGDRLRRELGASLTAIGRDLGVDVIDVDAAFGTRPSAWRYLTVDMMHPNALGHERIAHLLRDAIDS